MITEEVPQVVDASEAEMKEAVRRNYERIRTEVYNLIQKELNEPKKAEEEEATPASSS